MMRDAPPVVVLLCMCLKTSFLHQRRLLFQSSDLYKA